MSKIYILDEKGAAQIKKALKIDYDYHSTEDATTIDAALDLLAPVEVPEDAEELARTVIEAQHASNTYTDWVLNAAALLTAFAKRVPMAMLTDIYYAGLNADFPDAEEKQRIEQIVENHGYKVEE